MKNFVLNIYKPKDMGSFDVVRYFKHRSKEITDKLGHFGTLDPFAEGVLLIGFGQAARLNDFVHELMPKTYIGIGLLGKATETGDLTSEVTQNDETEYLKTVIANFSKEFIQDKLREKFVGEYWQAPHKYSASKFMGKKLHEWTRQGVDIKKEQKRREIYSLKVLEYNFPVLKIEFEVSSGTFIRTLFEECCQYLGTIGVLENLIRTKVGSFSIDQSLKREEWPKEKLLLTNLEKALCNIEDVLPISTLIVNGFQEHLLSNGQILDLEKHQDLKTEDKYFYLQNQSLKTFALGTCDQKTVKAVINFKD